MTNEELLKALRIHIDDGDCSDCPLIDDTDCCNKVFNELIKKLKEGDNNG